MRHRIPARPDSDDEHQGRVKLCIWRRLANESVEKPMIHELRRVNGLDRARSHSDVHCFCDRPVTHLSRTIPAMFAHPFPLCAPRESERRTERFARSKRARGGSLSFGVGS